MSLERLLEHRRIWEARPELRAVYGAWFDRLLDGIPAETRVLEVGAGPGFLAEAARARRPDLRWISSDLLGAAWNDVVADAGRLPFATGSVGAVVGLDVLHHLPRPAEFFRESARVLGGRGELRLVEPWITPLAWVVYRFFHQEECRLGVDPWDPFPGPGKDSFDGNAALPWRLLRQTPAWEWRRLGLEPPRRRRLNAWPYLLSLGFRERSLLPVPLVGALLALDRYSAFLSPLLALRAFLAWESSSAVPRSVTAPLAPGPRAGGAGPVSGPPEAAAAGGEAEGGGPSPRPRRLPALARRTALVVLGGLLALLAIPGGRPALRARWAFTHLLGDPAGVFDASALYEEVEAERIAFRGKADTRGWRYGSGEPVGDASGRGLRIPRDRATQRIFGPLDEAGEDTDVIEVKVEQPRPSPVALFWPRRDGRFAADHAIARLPGPDGTARFVVARDPRWWGRAARIGVQPSFEPQTVSVRSIRCLAYRLRRDPAPEVPTDVWTVELGGDSRRALAVAQGRPATIPVTVPPRSRLRFALGLPEHVTTGARFVLTVSEGGHAGKPVLDERLERGPADTGWSEREVDLGAWAGHRVDLSLRIEPERPDDSPIGFWGSPLLRVPAPAGRRRPSVLLVSADTLRADHLSLYGYPRDTSPALERWARRRGVVFRSTVAPSPWTLPSHVSLFTGLDAHRHGVSRQGPIPAGLPVLAERFRDAGYLTLASTGGGLVVARFGFDRGFDVFHSREVAAPADPRDALERGTDEVLRWLTAHAQEPFFLFFHTYATHTPLVAREPFFSRVRGHAGPLPDRPLDAEPVPPRASDGFRQRYRYVWTKPLPDGAPPEPARPPSSPGEPPLDLDDPHLAIDLYDSSIARLDEEMRRVLDRLEDLGLADETIVVFTSDHGESLGENGLWAHTHLHDTNLLVPLVVAPRPAFGPRTVEQQVRLVDVAPTILELAGLPPVASMQGRSLVPLLQGRAAPHPDTAWSYSSRTNWGLGLRVASRWKLIVPNTVWPALRGHDELYDLAADPGETTNLAGTSPAYAPLRALATRELEAIRQGVVVSARCERAPCFEGVLRGLGAERTAVTSPDLACACLEPVAGGTRLSLKPGDSFSIVYEDVADGELDITLDSGGAHPARTHVRRRVGPGQEAFALHLDGAGWHVDGAATPAPSVGLRIAYEGSATRAHPEVSREMEERLRAMGYVR